MANATAAPGASVSRPEKTVAILFNEELGRPTRHVYDHTDALTNGWAHIFKCTETGALRRWGFESRHGSGWLS